VDSLAAMATALEDTAAALDKAVNRRCDDQTGLDNVDADVVQPPVQPHAEDRVSDPGRPSHGLEDGLMERTLLAWACARLRSAAAADGLMEAKDGLEGARAPGPQPHNLEGDLTDGHVLLHLFQVRAPESP
jgi:hypothetical protein